MLITITPLLLLISLFALIAFISQRHHVLICLLRLEATLLSLAFALTIIYSPLQITDIFFCIIILSFGACEAAVALAVIVAISRTFGSDLISSINTNKC